MGRLTIIGVNTVACTLPNQSLVPGLKTRYWVIFTRAYKLFFYSTKVLKYYQKQTEILSARKTKFIIKEKKMTDLNNTFKPNDINKKEFDDTGIQICEHCRGTGVNSKYEKVNEIINAILDYSITNYQASKRPKSVAPYCWYCIGKGKIDRIRNNNKNYNKEIIAEIGNSKSCSNFYNDIEIFLKYVANFETIFDGDKEIEMHYNFSNDNWEEYNGPYDVPEAKRNLLRWMKEFQEDGYFEDVKLHYPSYYFYGKYALIKERGLVSRRRTDICDCCNRHYTELKRFKMVEEPLNRDYTGEFFNPIGRTCAPHMEYVEMVIEDLRRRLGVVDSTVDTKLYPQTYDKETQEALELRIKRIIENAHRSWECHDCVRLDSKEYYEKCNKNKMRLRF
jgi:hypothetical protein